MSCTRRRQLYYFNARLSGADGVAGTVHPQPPAELVPRVNDLKFGQTVTTARRVAGVTHSRMAVAGRPASLSISPHPGNFVLDLYTHARTHTHPHIHAHTHTDTRTHARRRRVSKTTLLGDRASKHASCLPER